MFGSSMRNIERMTRKDRYYETDMEKVSRDVKRNKKNKDFRDQRRNAEKRRWVEE